MKILKTSLSIFFITFIMLYPLIFKLTDDKITKKNYSETISKVNTIGLVYFRNLNELRNVVDKDISDINFNFFNNKNFIKFETQKYKIQIITIENLISDYNYIESVQDFINQDVRVSEASQRVYLQAKDQILLLFNFKIIEDMIEKNLKNNSFDFNDECSKVSFNNISVSFTNYATYEIALDIQYSKNSFSNSYNNNEIEGLVNKCLFKKLNMNNFISKYTETYDEFSKEDFNDNLNQFIIENSMSFSSKEVLNSFRDQMINIRNKIISKIKDTDIETDAVFISKIDTKNNFIKNYNIYLITIILNLLVTTIIFYILFFLKKFLNF